MRRRFFWMALPALALAPSGFSLVRRSDRDDSRCRPGCIVALGDSITSGAGLRASESYPSQLRTAIDVPVWNAGVSGEKTGDALKRLPPLLTRHEPRAVVLLLGINDSGIYSPATNLEAFARDLQAAVTTVRQAQSTPVLCSLFPVDSTALQASGLKADQWSRYDQEVETSPR